MKICIALTFLIMVDVVNLQANDTLKSHFKFGIKIYSDVTANSSISVLYVSRINYGIDIQLLKIIKGINLQTGFFKISKATVYDSNPIYFNNLSLPLGLVYENRFLYVLGGTYFDYTYSVWPKSYFTYYGIPELKKFSYGVYYGFGIEKEINSNWSIAIDIRQLMNLTNFERPHSPRHGNLTTGFSIGIHYKI